MSSARDDLTARSVLLSVLLGTDPPRLPVQMLVRTTELFGIAEGTTRTALSRMVTSGEVANDAGAYRLVGESLLARRARQQRSRAGATRRWDGRWIQATVVAGARRPAAGRARLRAGMQAARLAELREGVWLRPDNLGHGFARPEHDDVVWFTSVPDDDPAVLAGRLWDLSGWAGSSRGLVVAMGGLIEPLESGARDALADGFVLSAAVLRQFQADPLLPGPLLPLNWPGDELRATYDRYDAAYRAVLREWFRSQPA